MSFRSITLPDPRRRKILTVGAALAMALAACSSAGPGASDGAPSQSAAASAGTSQPTVARCEVIDGATTSASVAIASFSFGEPVTISAGQAVVFTNNDGVGHTLTEGTGGQAAAGACVDAALAPGSNTVVSFGRPGDYALTCKIHHTMQTTVHVT